MKVILHLTKDCNLRCKYCYAPSKVDEAMSVEVAKKGIDLAIKMGKTSACVSYFGGEPLLKFDEIQHLTKYAHEAGEKAGKKMHYRLSTNGTLFTEEILQFCAKYNILFAMSLDGDKQAHNAQRPFAGGVGSFDVIDSKLDMILRYNPLGFFVSIITPLSVSRLYESILYMWSRGIRYFVHQPDFSWPDWDRESFEILKSQYQKLASWYIETSNSGEHFYMNLFDEKLKSHAKSPIAYGANCDFGAKKFSVAPNGKLYPCVQFVSDKEDAKNFCIGDVESGFNSNWQNLIHQNKQERPQCEGCALVGRCANYCGCLNWQTTGKINTVSPLVCEHERMLIPIADEIGNQMWGEKNEEFIKKHYKYLGKEFIEYGID